MPIEMLLVRPAYVKISKVLSGHLPYELFTHCEGFKKFRKAMKTKIRCKRCYFNPFFSKSVENKIKKKTTLLFIHFHYYI